MDHLVAYGAKVEIVVAKRHDEPPRVGREHAKGLGQSVVEDDSGKQVQFQRQPTLRQQMLQVPLEATASDAQASIA